MIQHQSDTASTAHTRYTPITLATVSKMPQWEALDPDLREAIEVVGHVLPFRCNTYVADELIDWDNAPDDPIFQLTFPQKGMLEDEHYLAVRNALRAEMPRAEFKDLVNRICLELNPHPAGQQTHNVPHIGGEPVEGMQHKYRETALYFPSQGQTCHAYCTFCFRWAQFVGMQDLKFASKEVEQLVAYLRAHPEITDVLFTGGDPMIMKTATFAKYLEPILEVESVRTIRIGTKAVGYWPQRFVTDDDADDLLRLYERVVDSGRHLALMGHYSHPVELSTDVGAEAVRRIRGTGANVRMQSPVIRHVNDDASVWADLWQRGVALGAVPYYMFVERDTGAKAYFEMPLVRAWNIYRNAYQRVSGLARTVRGPSMSCFPGKCHVLGVTEVNGEQAFALEFLQHREPDMVRRPFFAKYDPRATWYDQLEPLTEHDARFFTSPEAFDAEVTVDGNRPASN